MAVMIFSKRASFFPLLVILCFCGNPQALAQEAKGSGPDLQNEMMDAKRQVAARINEKTPLKVDPVTTLLSVAATDRGFTYITRLEMSAAEIGDPQALAAEVKPHLVKSLCGQAFAKKATEELGQIYTYAYQDRSGAPLMSVDIGARDCR